MSNNLSQVPEPEPPEMDLTGAVNDQRESKGQLSAAKPRCLVPYPGGKTLLMPKLLPLFPDHYHYISVFGGSGADVLFKPPSKLETFNDLCHLIYNLFLVVKDKALSKELERKLEVPHCRELYKDAVRILRKPITDRVESAWAFLVVAHQGWATAHPLLKDMADWRLFYEAGYSQALAVFARRTRVCLPTVSESAG